MPEAATNNIFSAEDFKNIRHAIVAVSGGSDSLALLFLLQNYNKQCLGNKLKIIAVTIDHQLRPESAAEAVWVKKLCEKHGIHHHILNWTEPKPATALSAQARLARYKLLYECAKTYKNPILLTGHTLNDQIETFLMRQKRGNRRGLAAMSRLSLLFNQIYLLRPLLELSREELRLYLGKITKKWIEDPTNANLKYERAKIRHKLGQISDEHKKLWIKKLQEQAKFRINMNHKLTSLLHQHRPYFLGEVLHFTNLPYCDEIKLLLSICTALIGGAEYLPAEQQSEVFTKLFLSNKRLERSNLCRAIIEKKGTSWKIWREARHMPINNCLPNQEIIWDRRYKIHNGSNDIITIRPATQEELKEFCSTHKVNPYYYQSSLAIEKSGIITLPLLNSLPTSPQGAYINFAGITIQRHMAIYNWLVSGFDFELYKALAEIFNFSSCSL